jgi:integrase
MFKWASAHEMLPIEVYQRLKTVAALRRGRSDANESDPVRPVDIEIVNATKPHLSRQVSALVDLQLLTGARGGELFTLRPIDLEMDKKGGVWKVRPQDHKTAHHGHARTIFIGPKAQKVLQPFLTGRPVNAYLFSPKEAVEEHRAARAAKRKTPLKYGNHPGSNRVEKPRREVGAHYTAASYRRAIERACEKARITTWHPHQIRHTAATLIRKQFGLEAARLALGHSSALVTDAVYAQRDEERVVQVMKQLG